MSDSGREMGRKGRLADEEHWRGVCAFEANYKDVGTYKPPSPPVPLSDDKERRELAERTVRQFGSGGS